MTYIDGFCLCEQYSLQEKRTITYYSGSGNTTIAMGIPTAALIVRLKIKHYSGASQTTRCYNANTKTKKWGPRHRWPDSAVTRGCRRPDLATPTVGEPLGRGGSQIRMSRKTTISSRTVTVEVAGGSNHPTVVRGCHHHGEELARTRSHGRRRHGGELTLRSSIRGGRKEGGEGYNGGG